MGISTVLPPVGDTWIERFRALNEALARYPVNPDSFRVEQAEISTQKTYEQRSRFRLFYSLHSAVQSTREVMVPKAMPLAQAIPLLKRFSAEGGPNLLLHTVFVEGLNDGESEVDAMLKLLRDHQMDGQGPCSKRVGRASDPKAKPPRLSAGECPPGTR